MEALEKQFEPAYTGQLCSSCVAVSNLAFVCSQGPGGPA